MSNLNKCSKLINIYFGVEALYLKTTYLLFHWWWVLQRIILKVDKVNWNMLTSQLCRSKRQCYSHFHFRKYQPGLSSCKGAVRKAKEVKCFQEKYIERGKNSKGSKILSHTFSDIKTKGKVSWSPIRLIKDITIIFSIHLYQMIFVWVIWIILQNLILNCLYFRRQQNVFLLRRGKIILRVRNVVFEEVLEKYMWTNIVLLEIHQQVMFFYESFRLMAINQDLNKNTIDNIAILNSILIQSIANGIGSLVTKLSAWT